MKEPTHGYELPRSSKMQRAVMCEGVTVRYKSHEKQKDTHQLRSINHLPNAKQAGQPFNLKFTQRYAKSKTHLFEEQTAW